MEIILNTAPYQRNAPQGASETKRNISQTDPTRTLRLPRQSLNFPLAAENKPLTRNPREEFRLEQTSLDISKGINILRNSDGMGWTGLHATLVEKYPHENTHREIPDIWLSTALKVRDLDRTIGTGPSACYHSHRSYCYH